MFRLFPACVVEMRHECALDFFLYVLKMGLNWASARCDDKMFHLQTDDAQCSNSDSRSLLSSFSLNDFKWSERMHPQEAHSSHLSAAI